MKALAMRETDLHPDCARCAGLCCVLLAFDRGSQFAFDKPAATPCPNLDSGHMCTIHDRLAETGFHGCIAFDCHGAGQRVIQEVFEGRSWRDDPALMAPMTDAFRRMRTIHEHLALLATARTLDLTPALYEEIAALEARLDPAEGWTRDALAACDVKSLERDVQRFLAGLRDRVPA